MKSYTILDAEFPADLPDVVRLFRDYADWLGVDMGFQGFEEEIANLPGRYQPPGGALLLLRNPQDLAVGTVAMRDLGNGQCELKRMYLDMTARGQGQGRALSEAIIARARAAGYRRMVLDTVDYMGAALKLYNRLGFQPIAPYYNNPLQGAIYMGRDL